MIIMKLTRFSYINAVLILSLLTGSSFGSAPTGSNAIKDAYLKAENDIYHLEVKNFKTVTAKGSWLVFYGSSWCLHCQIFTPKWLQLQEYAMKEYPHGEMKLAKIECTKNKELCTDIKGFPTIKYYLEGKETQEYSGNHEFDPVKTFIADKVKESIKTEAERGKNKDAASNEPTSSATLEYTFDWLKQYSKNHLPPADRLNPNGDLVTLTDADFEETVNQGPWFIKFYAPWCSHCQALKPTWSLLASVLAGKVNVGEVDCTKERATCRKFNVQGYPTLLMLDDGEQAEQYRDSRQLPSLKEFALKYEAKIPFTPVRAKDIPDILKTNEVAFFFLYDYATMDHAALKVALSVLKPLKASVRLYVTCESQSYGQFQLAKTEPALLATKEFGTMQTVFKGSFSPDGASRTALRNWVLSQRLGLLPALDTSNQQILLKPGKVVILGLVDPSTPGHGKTMETLKASAKSIAGELGDNSKFQFAYLDAVKFATYVKKVYKVTPESIPRILLIDPKEDEYFDVDQSGNTFDIEQASIRQLLSRYEFKELSPKSTRGFFFTLIKPIYRFITQRPLSAVFVFLVGGYLVYRRLGSFLGGSGYSSVPANVKPE